MPKKRSSKRQTEAKQALLGRWYVLHEYLAYQMPNEIIGTPLAKWNYRMVASELKKLEKQYVVINDGWDEDLSDRMEQVNEWLAIIYNYENLLNKE